MFHKFIERCKAAIRSSALSTRIFFALTVIVGVIWALSGFHAGIFLLTGLMGVLWLSCMALHSIQSGKERRLNPFTLLIFLCIALGIGCFVYSTSGTRYNEGNEPIEWLTSEIQRALNFDSSRKNYSYDFLGDICEGELSELQHNLVITDENDKVLYALNNWRSGNQSTFYPLTVADNNLVVFIGENEQVTGAAQRAHSWVDERFVQPQTSLTRTEPDSSDAQPSAAPEIFLTRDQVAQPGTQTRATSADEDISRLPSVDTPADTEDAPTASPAPAEEKASSEPALTAREQLIKLYFPDFGQYINQFIYRLAHDPLLLGEETGWADLSFYEWQGETVVGLDREEAAHGSTALRGLVSELNALTDEQRESLKEYVAWYDSALTASRADNRNTVYARMLMSADGSRKAYLVYEYDYEKLMPVRQAWERDDARRGRAANLAVCMIPAVIVFLAFWVFVDAKRRGQSAPALWAVLTLIGNVITWIIYMMTRPQMTLSLNGKAAPRGMCPLCGTKLKSDFIACPGCGILLRSRCKNCGHALENDWSFCPYCASAVTKETVVTTTAVVSSAPAESDSE